MKMVKMTLSEGQFLTKIFDFRGHISTFRAENTPKSEAFKAKKQCPNNFWTSAKQLSKTPENSLFDLENGQMTLSEGQNLRSNFDFRDHISTFRAKNTHKS